MNEFVACYEPRMEQFLRTLETVEEAQLDRRGGPSLSIRMRESWDTGRSWFNYAARKSFDIDVVYWMALHDKNGSGSGEQLLDDESLAEISLLVKTKMEQLAANKKDCTAVFTQGWDVPIDILPPP